MKNEIIFEGALANCSDEFSAEDLLLFLKSRTKNVDYYKLNFPVGSIMATTFDWYAILSVTASTLAIGRALWDAYKKFIKPLHDKGDASSFLFITVKNGKKEFAQFCLGKDYTSKNTFIHEFSEKVETIRFNEADKTTVFEKREIKSSVVLNKNET